MGNYSYLTNTVAGAPAATTPSARTSDPIFVSRVRQQTRATNSILCWHRHSRWSSSPRRLPETRSGLSTVCKCHRNATADSFGSSRPVNGMCVLPVAANSRKKQSPWKQQLISMKATQLLANGILYEVSGNDVSRQAEKDLHFSRSHNALLNCARC